MRHSTVVNRERVRWVRLVANQVRGLFAEQASSFIAFSNKKEVLQEKSYNG